MDNTESIKNTVNKAAEALRKELEGLNDEGLHEFFIFFYKLNHQHGNMMDIELFEDFLASFDDNPFKVNTNKDFKKQLIDSIIKYAYDYMSLITAAVLIKKKFTLEEIAQNYYTNICVFEDTWF